MLNFLLMLFLVFSDLKASEEANNLLMYKLVKKGILSEEEAQVIRAQMADETKAQIEGNQTSWVKNLNPYGNFRFRYQNDHQITTDTNRDRVRIRLRGGLEPRITDSIKVGVGIATGFNNNNLDNLSDKDMARSTNQTLGDGFSKKSISLELGYAEYTPLKWMSFTVGKFKNPIWEPGDLIWDTDINPEGIALSMKGKIDQSIELFGTTDIFSIDERSDEPNIIMYVAQGGLKHKISDRTSYKLALSYYGFSDLKGKKIDGSPLSNSVDSEGRLLYDYKNIVASFEFGIKNTLGDWAPYFGILAEYVSNINSKVPRSNRNGYMAGINIGYEKLNELCDWQLKYNYAVLEKDSILDIFPDSDRYGGKTNMKAHELSFNFAMSSNNWFGLDFYYGERLRGIKDPATVLQLDWNIKF